MIIHRYYYIIPSIFMLIACGGGSDSPDSVTTPDDFDASRRISGQIFNADTGNTVAGAAIQTSGASTISGANGSFLLEGFSVGERLVVSVKKTGFADQSKIVLMPDDINEAIVSTSILPVDLSRTFNPDTAQTLSVSGSSASVSLGATSLVRANNLPPNGDATIELTVIDPTQDIDFMPGDLSSVTGSGQFAPIESFGAITATFKDSSGAALNLAAGSTSTIRIPLADVSGSPPSSIPLYYYDEIAGVWIEEGSASLVNNLYYEGTVSHFSTWNADVLYPSIEISGCVEDLSGAKVTGVRVDAVGDDYSGKASVRTNSEGDFSVSAKLSSSVLVSGFLAGKTNTVQIETRTSDITMDNCLVLPVRDDVSGASASIKLTWGERPYDLDSHLVGPVGSQIHVSFFNEGSLVSHPFMQLDTDDVHSRGPEIITIFQFSQAGTYRYSVHNYSGTFNPGMTGSRTRVELTIDGRIMFFSPPSGEGQNETWNVFEFVVDGSGGATVTTVNQWADSSPGRSRLRSKN